MSSQSPPTFFTLQSGDVMPLIGYGTYRVRGRDLIRAVLDFALDAGYRLIDTAIAYDNEAEIGEALTDLLPKHNLKREDIFITSKLSPHFMGKTESILEAVKTSLNNLQVEYLDLYLIHWPGPQRTSRNTQVVVDNATMRDRTWTALVEAKNRGWLRNIGVSNYAIKHLIELLVNNHGVIPAVNQVEWHPFWHQEELLHLCQVNKILLQAYFSLGGTDEARFILKEENVTRISHKLQKSSAQVLLVWALQQGIGVIPKSLSQEHINENINLDFLLPDGDFLLLNSLPQRRLGGDPEAVE